jgi:hypothetical protein
MSLFSELKRRGVIRMAAIYVVTAWFVVQVADPLFSLASLPAWSGQVLLGLLVTGFPIALIFSWFFEVTPEGVSLEKDVPEGQLIKHATSRRMDFVIIAILSAGLLMFAWDKWWQRGPQELSIAVLPFENMSADPEQEYFSDGISDEVRNLVAKCRHRDNSPATQRAAYPGRQRAAQRQPGAHYRATDRCRRQQSPLVAALRSRLRRRKSLQYPGRNRACDHGPLTRDADR